MPKQQRGRHAAPRAPRTKGALAVPVVLLGTGGGAVGGLAGVPGISGPTAVAVAQVAAVSPVQPTTGPSEEKALALEASAAEAARQEAARTVAEQRARSAAELRASRTRRVSAEIVAEQEAEAARAAAERLAAEEAARKAAEEAARPKAVRPAGGHVSSHFGPRWGRLHAGIDLAAAYGSPVRAAVDGVIVESGFDSGYGNFVRLQDDEGYITTYNHMSRVFRRSGALQAGDVIGQIGSTGSSTGPHLHFEVRTSNGPINPLPWLRARGVGL